MFSQSYPIPRLNRFIFLLSIITVVVAVAALIGWVADIGALKSFLPGHAEMRPVAAIGFILLAVGLAVSSYAREDSRLRYVAAGIGIFTGSMAFLMLSALVLRFSTGFDSFLVPDLNVDPALPGYGTMAPHAPVNFLLISASLTLLAFRDVFKKLGVVCAVLALVATYAALLGHLFQADQFYGFSKVSGMALPTAILFVIVSVGLISLHPKSYIIELLTSDSLGGIAARRLIPVVVLVPTFIGWLRVMGQNSGYYDTGFGTAMSTFVLVLLMFAIVFFYSGTVHKADSKRRKAEIDLVEKENRYRELFDYSQGLICIHDLDGVLITVNRASLSLLGYNENEMVGKNLRAFVPADRHLTFDAYLRQVTHEGIANGLLQLESKSGKQVIMRYHNILATEEGREPYVLGHAQDVTALLEAQKQLKNLSLTDELTGLYNRRGFLTLAEQQLRLERHHSTARGLTLMFADMDGLKAVNDTYGHDAGNDAIIEFASAIRSCTRSADLAARWGGDEFVILLIGPNEEKSKLTIERIRKKIEFYNETSGKPYQLAFSVGVADFDIKSDRTLEDQIAEADEAMYADKRRRKQARPTVTPALSVAGGREVRAIPTAANEHSEGEAFEIQPKDLLLSILSKRPAIINK